MTPLGRLVTDLRAASSALERLANATGTPEERRAYVNASAMALELSNTLWNLDRYRSLEAPEHVSDVECTPARPCFWPGCPHATASSHA